MNEDSAVHRIEYRGHCLLNGCFQVKSVINRRFFFAKNGHQMVHVSQLNWNGKLVSFLSEINRHVKMLYLFYGSNKRTKQWKNTSRFWQLIRLSILISTRTNNSIFPFVCVCVTVINEGFYVVPQQSFCPCILFCAELLACNEEVNKTMRFQIDNLLPIQLWLIVIAPPLSVNEWPVKKMR